MRYPATGALNGHHALKPYLLAKLRSAYPSAAKTVEVDAAATEWKASGVKITNRSQLAEYLEDVRWGGTSSALMERVLCVRVVHSQSRDGLRAERRQRERGFGRARSHHSVLRPVHIYDDGLRRLGWPGTTLLGARDLWPSRQGTVACT